MAAPAAQAHHAPAEHTTGSPPSVSTWTASGREIDRLGPKHVPLHHRIAPPPPTVVKVVKSAGFNGDKVAIGGGITGVVALIAVLTLFLTRRSGRAALPERAI